MMKLNKTVKVTTGWIHQRSVRRVFALMAARRPTRPAGGDPSPVAGALLSTDIGPALSCPRCRGSYESTTYARPCTRSQRRRCGIRHAPTAGTDQVLSAPHRYRFLGAWDLPL